MILMTFRDPRGATTAELAVCFGVAVATTCAWRKLPTFPSSALIWDRGLLFWNVEAVEAWLRTRPNRNGMKAAWRNRPGMQQPTKACA